MKSVNFLDKQSIIDSGVNELVKIGKLCKMIWNYEVPSYGNYDCRYDLNITDRINIVYEYQSIIKMCNQVFTKIETAKYEYDDKKYQKYKKIFYEKYVDSKQAGLIYKRPITIYDDIKVNLKDKLIELYNSGEVVVVFEDVCLEFTLGRNAHA